MIVIVHLLGHNILSSSDPINIETSHFKESNLLFSLCVCAVDTFVIISGYFLIRFSVKRLLLFLLPISFYQLIIGLFYEELSLSPFNYWFVPPYVALMLLAPFLNKGLVSVTTKQLTLILCIIFLCFILPLNSVSGMNGKNTFMFVCLYLIGHYIRTNYEVVRKIPNWIYFILFIIVVILIYFETILITLKIGFQGTQTLSYSYDNILIVFAAVFLFIFFSKLKINSKLVNWIGKSSFFVYIISENENVYGNTEGKSLYSLINFNKWYESDYFIIYVLISALVIFFSCIIIDKIRLLFFSRFENYLGAIINTRIDKNYE